MRMRGRTVLVVGGTSGIGRGLAARLRAAGNEVIVAGRRVEPDLDVTSLRVDVSDPDSVLALHDTVVRLHPDVDTVVAMSGIMLAEDLLDQDSLAIAEESVAVNLLGTIRLVSAFTGFLLEKDEAVLMTVSSGLAFVPLPMAPTYCATKAAIHSFTESLRVQLAGTSVQVIELVPPGVRTTLFGQAESNQGMPLEDYLDEVMGILATQPDVREVCVSGVDYLRGAERRGEYAAALALLSRAE